MPVMDTEQIREHLTAKHVLGDLLYTVIISTLIAVFLFTIGIARPFVASLVTSLSYGISIFSVITLLFRVFNPNPEKTAHMVLVVLVASIAATLITLTISPLILERFFSMHTGPVPEYCPDGAPLFRHRGRGLLCLLFQGPSQSDQGADPAGEDHAPFQ